MTPTYETMAKMASELFAIRSNHPKASDHEIVVRMSKAFPELGFRVEERTGPNYNRTLLVGTLGLVVGHYFRV